MDRYTQRLDSSPCIACAWNCFCWCSKLHMAWEAWVRRGTLYITDSGIAGVWMLWYGVGWCVVVYTHTPWCGQCGLYMWWGGSMCVWCVGMRYANTSVVVLLCVFYSMLEYKCQWCCWVWCAMWYTMMLWYRASTVVEDIWLCLFCLTLIRQKCNLLYLLVQFKVSIDTILYFSEGYGPVRF